jgi:superfamily II DNA or RNA helicase
LARLEDLTIGSRIVGILGEAVTVVSTKWYGSASIEVFYKTDQGATGSQILYREDEAGLSVAEKSLPWSFDVPGELLLLGSEAYRIHLAHLFDPYLAVHTSAIEPLPHQISAVYEEMLPRLPLRYVLADDPGAGKTIMTGLLLKELIIRGDLKRCMIVCPGNLAEQWQDELYQKLHLRFEILTNDRLESSITGNIFTEMHFCIARLDKLSRNEELQAKLKITDWDLIVCDEAHKMSATIFGGEIKYTKRYQLGRLLSGIARHFLLLTATPHNGKEEDFQLFMALIDADRFEGACRTSHQSIEIDDVMRRLVKEDLLKFDGTPLFPERLAYTVHYDLSPMEAQLYTAVTTYVQEEFNRADQLDGKAKNTVGFALTILQRRLASSPEAIYQSLRRRRERLEGRLLELRLGKRARTMDWQFEIPEIDDPEDVEDMPAQEAEQEEEQAADRASAARTMEELEAEIGTLERLEAMANEVRASGTDKKWDELSALLQDNQFMYDPEGQREKLIIFTEHRDTLNYLADKIRTLFGRPEAVVTIHGGMLRDERRKVETLFKQDKDVRLLIATDAAGEGINLQRAHLMVNYDLPWNPNRIEQRFGRIHRIGQTEVCHLWNLVSGETREGAVYRRLFEKLEQERSALGGKVFDILGKVTFDNKPLRDLLIEAIRYGNLPETRARLYRVVDRSLDKEALRRLIEENALTEDAMDVHRVMAIREEMERMEAHKLQPYYIETFFLAAFKALGGTIRRREEGRYEVVSVPYKVRSRDRIIGFGVPVAPRYERVCFDKAYCTVQGLPLADQICPGHPLLEAVIDLVREQNADVLKRGSILVDENDPGENARLLFYIEDSIQDGVLLPGGSRRIIDKRLQFVELEEGGAARNAGYAPYLDYRPATDMEGEKIRAFARSQAWLSHGVEDMAMAYAIEHIVPAHYGEVRRRKGERADKIARAVKMRLTAEIQYWDARAADLKEKEAAGKPNARLNSRMAQRRADELQARMQKRLAELEQEKKVSPCAPVIAGGALVVPMGLYNKVMGLPNEGSLFGANRAAIEKAAMKAVLQREKHLGYEPRDVSAENVGYDVESRIPLPRRDGTRCLRFIEVKGRQKGSATVTVTRNEILTALNKPEEYLLALVEVDGAVATKTVYIRKPFGSAPDAGACSVNYEIADLMQNGEIEE